MTVKHRSKKIELAHQDGVYSIFPVYNVDPWIDLDQLDELCIKRFETKFNESLAKPLPCTHRQVPIIEYDNRQGKFTTYTAKADTRIYQIDNVRYYIVMQYNYVAEAGLRPKGEQYEIRKQIKRGEYKAVPLSKFNERYPGRHCDDAYATTATHDIYLRPRFSVMLINIQHEKNRELLQHFTDNDIYFDSLDTKFYCMEAGSYKDLYCFWSSNDPMLRKATQIATINDCTVGKLALDYACSEWLALHLRDVKPNIRVAESFMQRWNFQKECFDAATFDGNCLGVKINDSYDPTRFYVAMEYIGVVEFNFSNETNTIKYNFRQLPKFVDADTSAITLLKPSAGFVQKTELGEFSFDNSANMLRAFCDSLIDRSSHTYVAESLDEFETWYKGLVARIDAKYNPTEKEVLRQTARYGFLNDLWRFRH